MALVGKTLYKAQSLDNDIVAISVKLTGTGNGNAPTVPEGWSLTRLGGGSYVVKPDGTSEANEATLGGYFPINANQGLSVVAAHENEAMIVAPVFLSDNASFTDAVGFGVTATSTAAGGGVDPGVGVAIYVTAFYKNSGVTS